MEFIQPLNLAEALEAKEAHPRAVPIRGGTDVMVELNFARSRPDAVIDLSRVEELEEWGERDGLLRVGAGVSYTRIIEEVGERLPGLAMASRTVGSPQIRNRGTVGGNLGTASPAGDGLPPLYASEAEVEVVSAGGSRRIPVADFVSGPKQNTLAGNELISAFYAARATGPQQYAKIGTRNAMVIAVCAFALALHPEKGRVGTCIGSAGPTPIRAGEAERFVQGVIEEGGLWESRNAIPPVALRRFGELVAGAARPIDDVRGTAGYRRHSVGVLARRTLGWAWDEYRG
ncbi:MAG: Xanthine dehydrogenase, FAD binding subunit [uncultured Rubrobacteraceae bacterium]|uniref:Xanthine dehydrogenase, FAD binding subunit n=1 Tax=uncultured Rubrobacteraceae bacterium TaxID=349277 RepID=A0A6J4PSV4_9ACTN|nr:MAG: Xanthine dehydrogenase, FAD binding subunit [uncultured Rubrobacteraceae bacterium]